MPKPLDPMPYLWDAPRVGGRINHPRTWSIGYLFTFSPRPEYEQDQQKYPA